MFDDFDFDLLDDPDFKEDSVREELIVPIIKKLGYSAHGENKIIRSKSLVHPYVAIGSKQRKMSIIPDYMFLAQSKCYWVLDAKSPTENILKSKHVEQAYSYAIHPEVRAKYYALCNGKAFVLYSINKFEPLLHFNLSEIGKYWEVLNRILNPLIKANDKIMDYRPDYGVHLLKLGASQGFKYIALAVNSNFVCKVAENLYTLTTVVEDSKEYALSLDFNESQLKTLLTLQTQSVAYKLAEGLKRQPYYVFLESNEELRFGVTATIAEEVQTNAEETYLPFIVDQFSNYVDIFEQ